MTEHWCKEHQRVWFKKGNMKNYAHPILDEDGNQMYDDDGKALWCNQPKEETNKSKPTGKDEMSKEEWAEKDRFLERCKDIRTAIIEAPNIVRLYVEFPNDRIANAAYDWEMSILSNFSSIGETVEGRPDEETLKKAKKIVSESKPGEEEAGFIDLKRAASAIEQLVLAGNDAYEDDKLLAYMKKTYKSTADTPLKAASLLNKGQAAHFENMIEQSLKRMEEDN